MPKAYVISEVAIRDETLAARYRDLAAASIAEHGGHYLVRAAPIDVLEGASSEGRLVIVEFPSLAQAQRWYDSPAYAPARKLRESALERRLLIVEGVEAMAEPLSHRAVFFVRDTPRALAYYTEQLSFAVDWIHEEAGRPYVAQVSLLGCGLILNQRERADDERPGTGRVFFGLNEAQSVALRAHVQAHAIPIVHVRWGQPTLAITDLDGNQLFFWLPEAEHAKWRELGWDEK